MKQLQVLILNELDDTKINEHTIKDVVSSILWCMDMMRPEDMAQIVKEWYSQQDVFDQQDFAEMVSDIINVRGQ